MSALRPGAPLPHPTRAKPSDTLANARNLARIDLVRIEQRFCWCMWMPDPERPCRQLRVLGDVFPASPGWALRRLRNETRCQNLHRCYSVREAEVFVNEG